MTRAESGNTSFYIKDKNLYLKRIAFIKETWFTLYQEQLTTSDAVQKALEMLVTNLTNEEGIKNNVDSRKISDQYCRIGE